MDSDRRAFEELLAGFLEGDLTPAERETLKGLLQSDGVLRARFVDEVKFNQGLFVVSREAPSAAQGERSEFAEAILSGWRVPTVRRKGPARAAASPWWSPFLVAASILLGIGILWLLVRPQPSTAPGVARPPVQDAREAARRNLEREEQARRLREIERDRQQALDRQQAAREDADRRKAAEDLARLEREKRELEEKVRASTPVEVVKTPAPPVPAPPQDPPPPKDPQPRATAVVAATLIHTRGEAYILAEGARKVALSGQPLLLGDGLETVGTRSSAVFEYPDGTQVELMGDTVLRRLAGADAEADKTKVGRKIVVDRGTVSASVSRQPPDRQMVFSSPHGEARVLGTSLLISVDLSDAGSTTLQVDEGKVRFVRLRDSATVDVVSGHYAVVAAGSEFSARPVPPEPRTRKPVQPRDVAIEAAVRRGIQFLKSEHSRNPLAGVDRAQCSDELVLWTMIHAGVPDSDPDLSRLLKQMLEGELKFTYRVSLQAMILEQLDRVRYQKRIQQCAQFLVDNQLKTGMWSYGDPSPFVQEIPIPKEATAGTRPKGPDASLPPGLRPKPRVLRKVVVTQKREATSGGDNSNTQYAALGLRACHDAGVLIPKEVVDRAVRWWKHTQFDDERQMKAGGKGKGWAYGTTLLDWSGSMTAGAAGSLVLYQYIKGEDWTRDAHVQAGLEWLARHWSVTENPGLRQPATFAYYLHAVERLGILYGTDLIGTHDWHSEIGKALLDLQRADGSWKPGENAVYDTCFAILCLKRATSPLVDVASVDRLKKR